MSKQAFYYSEGPYLRSLQSLNYALLHSETFIQFMGAPGSGKTSLCDKLALYMERKGHDVFFVDRQLDSPEMLRSVLANKFNLPSSNNFARLLEDSLAQAEEKVRVLIFDDAHLLSDITLIEIHRLSEIQVDSKRLLNIVLCGEPQLEKRLGSKSEFKSLTLNVTHKFLLEPMSQEEVGQFASGYLEYERVPNTPISTAAMALIFRTTKGFPGPAMLVAKLIADSRRGASIASELSKEELAGLIKASNIQAALPTSQVFDSGQLKVIAPMAVVFSIAVLGFLYQLTLNRPDSPEPEIPVVESMAATSSLVEQSQSPFASGNTESDVIAEAEAPQETVAEVSSAPIVQPQSEPIIPSLLRPAPMFSVEEEPVSDSSLSLVTAAEIGVTGELLQVPEFAELAVIEAEQSASAATINAVNAEVSVEVQPALSVAAVEGQAKIETSSGAVVTPVVEEVASRVESASQSSGQFGQVEEDGIQESVSVVEPSSIPDVPGATEPASIQDVISIPEPEEQADIAVIDSYRDTIDTWLDAWAAQDMDGYFASYDTAFEPRYDATLNRWRRNRTRVITNAGSITLNLSEFSVVTEDESTVEVNFWLDYESPTYSDSTLKKLVLSKASGSWLILEEVNLRVRS